MKKKICFVVARPGSAESFLKDHIRYLSNNFDIYLVANLSGKEDFVLKGLSGVKDIKINRPISLKDDLKAVKDLKKYFKEMQFDAVHSVTPKAGLITALAAKSAGIKNRIHIFTGQVWATRHGVMRSLLKFMDKIIVRRSTQILVDGEAQRKFLIKEGVVSEKKSKVLGAGSICGANTVRYTPSSEERNLQRKNLDIHDETVVFSFMGRMNREKGIYELLTAFNKLAGKYKNISILFYGRDEERCLEDLGKYENINESNFFYPGSTPVPEKSLQAADVFVMPSYREGFGMSVIEASCLGLPVICSDTYGLGDTMVDNETGLRCKTADVETLYKAMEKLYLDKELRRKLGEAGRNRVKELFAGEKIVKEWSKFYSNLLN